MIFELQRKSLESPAGSIALGTLSRNSSVKAFQSVGAVAAPVVQEPTNAYQDHSVYSDVTEGTRLKAEMLHKLKSKSEFR
jgi:hypothetical protein